MRLGQFEVVVCGSGTKHKVLFAKNTNFRSNRPTFGPHRPSVWGWINLKSHQTSQVDFMLSCHILMFSSQLNSPFVEKSVKNVFSHAFPIHLHGVKLQKHESSYDREQLCSSLHLIEYYVIWYSGQISDVRPNGQHCKKSVRIRCCSGPHFPAFWLNMEIYAE